MAKPYRKLEDWRPIIEAFEASGDSVSAFCRRRGIKRPYFLNRRKALREADQRKTFVRVPSPAVSCEVDAVMVSWQEVRLALPLSVSPSWLAQLLRELGDAPVS